MSGSIYNEFDGKQYSDQSTGERLESSIRELNEWKARAEAAERRVEEYAVPPFQSRHYSPEELHGALATLAAVRKACQNLLDAMYEYGPDGAEIARAADHLRHILDEEGEK